MSQEQTQLRRSVACSDLDSRILPETSSAVALRVQESRLRVAILPHFDCLSAFLQINLRERLYILCSGYWIDHRYN